jgi:hypothetical protein
MGRPDFTPAQIGVVEAWLHTMQQGFDGPFRSHAGRLYKALGFTSSHVCGVLRRQRPDLWLRMNRLRDMWYEKRDSVVKNSAGKALKKTIAARLKISDHSLRLSAKRIRHRGRSEMLRWKLARNDDDLEEALLAFEEGLACVDAEPIPVPPLSLLRDFQKATGLDTGAARRAIEYHRPDFFKAYKKLQQKYRDALDEALRSNATTAEVADWFDLAESTVRGARKRIRDAHFQR